MRKLNLAIFYDTLLENQYFLAIRPIRIILFYFEPSFKKINIKNKLLSHIFLFFSQKLIDKNKKGSIHKTPFIFSLSRQFNKQIKQLHKNKENVILYLQRFIWHRFISQNSNSMPSWKCQTRVWQVKLFHEHNKGRE